MGPTWTLESAVAVGRKSVVVAAAAGSCAAYAINAALARGLPVAD
jgi:hypothetical protein